MASEARTRGGHFGDDGAEYARRRAVEAGVRAERLRATMEAARGGREPLHGTTPEDLDLAAERADHALIRLRLALEASAHAHDRAADAFEEQSQRYGDPEGTRATRAADHRREAQLDRDRAAKLDRGR